MGWLIPEITESVIAAGKATGAAILVPGNVYPYETEPAPLGPGTSYCPVRRKGRIRALMEATYRLAAETGGPRVILLRAGDFLLPDAPQILMKRVILAKVTKGKVTAIGPADALHAFACLPDMARAAAYRAADAGHGVSAFHLHRCQRVFGTGAETA